jgi:AsmA protein
MLRCRPNQGKAYANCQRHVTARWAQVYGTAKPSRGPAEESEPASGGIPPRGHLCDNERPALDGVIDMRALKLVGIAVGGLVALLVVVLLAVRLFVDPNDYKDRIAQAVKRSTGRELTLAGPIKLSVFPWIALETGPASLGNPPGFDTEPFAAIRHVILRVKLLSLLRRQFEIGQVEIDGLDLRLRKNSAGKGNWQDFGGGTQSAAPAGPGTGPGTLPELAGVVIENSRVSYQETVADNVSLQSGRVTAGTPVAVKLKLNLTTGPGAKPIDLASQFMITLDPRKKQYRFAPLEMQGTVALASGTGPAPWKFSISELNIDLAAQTLAVAGLTVELGTARLAGRLRGSAIVDAPEFSGSFKLEPVQLRELMTKMGVAPPLTRDAKAFTRLAAQGDFGYRESTLAVKNLDVQLDDSQLRGNASFTDFKTKATRFDLAVDSIDIDRYRGPEESAPQPTDTQPGKPSEEGAQPASDVLKTLDMNGTLKIGRATLATLNVSQVLVTVVAKDGVTHISPARAKLYGGDYTGDITLDSRGTSPVLKLDQSLTRIEVAPLLEDFAKSQRISGRGNLTTQLTTRALSGKALLKTLNGHVAVSLDNGAIEGVDLWFEIQRALALIQKQAMPAGSGSGRTRFDAFKASAELTDGLASTQDLNIASQNLRITGQGTANLVTDAINYQAKATILKAPPGAGAAAGKTLADIPLNIAGTLSRPTVRPDLEGLAKARLQQEIENRKGELQQKLMDKLKGIFK